MTIEYKIPYNPLPKQKEFLDKRNNIILYSGAFGAGKSSTICVAVILEALRYYNNRILVLRKRFVDLQYTTMKSFFELMTPNNRLIKNYHKSNNSITLLNGSEIIFGGLDRATKWASSELGAFAIDEATEVTEEDFNMLISRLRKSNIPKHRGFLACNPSSKAHFLYDKFFIQRQQLEYGLVETSSIDNTFLPSSTIERYQKWKITSPEYYKRYILGEWGSFEGLVYSIFSESYNKKAFEIEEGWRFFRAIDWGYENPFVCLWIALDKDDNIYIFDELYINHKLLGELAEEIKNRYRDLRFDATYADPSDKQNMKEFINYGLLVTGAKNSVESGIRAVTEYIPKLFVHPRCKNTIREFQSYKWLENRNDNNKSEVPMKSNDHTMDALRYFIYTYLKQAMRPMKLKKVGMW